MVRLHLSIRRMNDGEAATCEAILRSLTNWFALEDALQQYRRDIEVMETYVAVRGDEIVGFLTLNQHNLHTTEVHVMAVREEAHGHGIGRALMEHAEQLCISRSVEYLEVKTLGPSTPSEYYARTRHFYLALGFRPLEELNLWGAENPCLIMIKHLVCCRDSGWHIPW